MDLISGNSCSAPSPAAPFLFLFNHLIHYSLTVGNTVISTRIFFYKKGALPQYVDNTCSTGRSGLALNMSISQSSRAFILKLFLFYFFPPGSFWGGVGGGTEMFWFALREYFLLLSLLLTRVCALSSFHFPTRQGHLHHLHFMKLFLKGEENNNSYLY